MMYLLVLVLLGQSPESSKPPVHRVKHHYVQTWGYGVGYSPMYSARGNGRELPPLPYSNVTMWMPMVTYQVPLGIGLPLGGFGGGLPMPHV